MAVETGRHPQSPLMVYGKRLLMALGLVAPFLAWSLHNTVPYHCFDEALAASDVTWQLAFCGFMHPQSTYIVAGGVVVAAFVAPTAYRLVRPRLASWWTGRDRGAP